MTHAHHGLGAGFQQLEDRTLPHTAFGIPWADPGHLTLSFAPDGAATQVGANSLSRVLSAAGPTAAWQREILRAFQTWAAFTNVNVGLVRDGGQPFGVSGAVQSDQRFGDIRVGAAPLSPGVVASASPFSWTGTTLSGDLLFNAAQAFRLGNVSGAYDVFSIALHEAGHALGLDHSHEAGSALGEKYTYRSSIAADDVADVREMYGVRVHDRYDAAGGNDTAARASVLAPAKLGNLTLTADGDLTTLTDADYYRFTVPPLASLLGKVTVRLQAEGLSLVLPRITITDGSGRVVASAASHDPRNNDVTLQFTPSPWGGNYYVKVEGATNDVFGIGGYRLAVDGMTLNAALSPLTAILEPTLQLRLGDTLTAVVDLLPVGGAPADRRFDATHRAAISDSGDTDTYRVRAPAADGSAPLNLNVMVWGTDADPLDPRVRVYDADGRPVAFQVLANESGLMSVQVLGVQPGADYYVQVSARDGGATTTGGYFFGADFNQFAPTMYDGVAGGALDIPGESTNGRLSVEAGVFQFALSAELLGAGAAGVTMTVRDAAGNVVVSLSATAGQPTMTAVRYLAAGSYTVRYDYRSPAGSVAAPMSYGLFLLRLSDGVGPYATGSSTTHGTPSGSSGGTSGDTDSGYTYTGTSTTRPSGYGYYF
ncbi:MAG TPA: matrixin family metalloprotease [Fimbriiglobus sp.]|jgi:hypothetical protein|nr:matrixin family metalloprotease [Fimbriiglobus sp.]